MLFNSLEFLYLFLPTTLAVFFLLPSAGWQLNWLIATSFFFYGWWNAAFVPLLIFSILANFAFHRALIETPNSRNLLLTISVAFNLLMLGVFKYASFFTNIFNDIFGTGYHVHITLPLAISFFTFQQIAMLADTWRGEVGRVPLRPYALFVVFFPQLIAGPIVHHREMTPQFPRTEKRRFRWDDFFFGLNMFALGLAKKVLLADQIAPFADEVFNAAARGDEPTLFEAWGATLAYGLEIYFDFSGYADMAMGLARIIGVRLPLNFDSPYRTTSIIDFWRRWHMTLSRFLRDYLYFPLGGNRKGPVRRHVNLMIVMLLGGLWHGAGWTFVLWGALHGVYLIVNHGWRAVRRASGLARLPSTGASRFLGLALTLLAVTLAWVPFRAADLETTMRMYAGLAGLHGAELPLHYARYFAPLGGALEALNIRFVEHDVMFNLGLEAPMLAAMLLIATVLPNGCRVIAGAAGDADAGRAAALRLVIGRPNIANAVWLALVFVGSALFILKGSNAFIYFQF